MDTDNEHRRYRAFFAAASMALFVIVSHLTSGLSGAWRWVAPILITPVAISLSAIIYLKFYPVEDEDRLP